MSLLSIVLVGIAAVTHAIWNLATKQARGSAAFLALCSVFTLVLYAAPTAWMLHVHGLPQGRAVWACIVASALIHFVYFNVLNHGYRVADLSIVYPVARGTGPLLSVGVAVSVLGERPSRLALLGAVVVVAGVFSLAGGARLLHAADRRARAGLYWGGCTGLVIASYTVVDGYAVRMLGLTPLLLDYGTHVVRVTLTLPKLLRDRAATRAELQRTWRYVLIVGALSPLAYILVLIAMQYSPISYVAPARELSMLVGAFFGARLLGEGDVRSRIVFAAVIAVGVMLIAVG